MVNRYFDGFRNSDHAAVLSCLHEDICWKIHGYTEIHGKNEFDAEIESPAFAGSPSLDIEHLVEEGDMLVALGSGLGTLASGALFAFRFCTAFQFRDEWIAEVQSFVVPVAP